MAHREYVIPIETRLRDMDPAGHVNNPVYAVYLQEARVKFLRDHLDYQFEDISIVVVHLEIDYHRSLTWGQDIQVTLRPDEVGTTSVTFDYELGSDGTRLATARTVHVWVDDEGEATPVPEGFRKAFVAD